MASESRGSEPDPRHTVGGGRERLPWHAQALNFLAFIPRAEYHTAGSPMTFSPETTRAWVDVDLAALVANARTVAAVSGSRLLPMVKANGYGLGATKVALALESVDPWGFGVASLDEARLLRDAGITRPILVMAPLMPQCIEQYLDLDLRPSISDVSALESWIARGGRPFHVEVDTGMSRAGVRWDDRASLGRFATLLQTANGW